jgi:putative hydrolase of the HAD superfamily
VKNLLANRFLLFDAVGTLLHPRGNVAHIYHTLGAEFGSTKNVDEIRAQFPIAFRIAFSDRADQPASELLEQGRWRQVVAHIFSDISDHEGLFERLWNHFADSANWVLFDDAHALLSQLVRRGIPFGIASNFDQRLEQIVKNLSPLNQCDCMFISSQLGYAKPGHKFFRLIQERLDLPPARLCMVGDDWNKDIAPAAELGWQTFWICRESAPEHLLPQPADHSFGAEHALAPAPQRIRSLTELA